jgi:hypothetical protein
MELTGGLGTEQTRRKGPQEWSAAASASTFLGITMSVEFTHTISLFPLAVGLEIGELANNLIE